jgi:vacuolar-type H+-ATPase subunit E/Vma4
VTTPTRHSEDALAPVRDALLAAARSESDRRVARAREEAAATVEQARAEARRVLEEARTEGERDAAALAQATRTHARRKARATVLRAQRQVNDELRRRAAVAVTSLRDDPAYPALMDRLSARARAVLGRDAEVVEAPEGGVLASAPGRRFVCTLPDLARDALDHEELALAERWAR